MKNYSDFMQFGHDLFYRISDKLLKHQSYIEAELYQREKDLFSLEDCIFLYDLTNTYFEGVCSRNPKAKYSKNQKEKRSDCPQVMVALVLDGDGFIRHHRVFEGKMSDSKSLDHIVGELESEFTAAIHAVTPEGFELKVALFLVGYSLNIGLST